MGVQCFLKYVLSFPSAFIYCGALIMFLALLKQPLLAVVSPEVRSLSINFLNVE